jgi:hypothetical protein
MKTSWNETRQIDQHLAGTMDTGDALVFDAKLLLDAELVDKVSWQRKTHAIIKQYGRRQLKNELEAIHQKLFTSPQHHSFSQRIRRLFKKP